MRIRRATADDLETLALLRLAFIADVRQVDIADLSPEFGAVTRAFLQDRFRAGRLHSWLAEEGPRPIGLVSVVVADGPPLPEEHRSLEGYVINMYVPPDARGRGVARSLLDEVVARAPSFGFRRLYLYATDAGLPLYRNTGFTTDQRWMALRLPLDSPDP